MEFDPTSYGPDVARVLALYENGQRLFPLAWTPCVNEEAKEILGTLEPKQLFPNVEEPEAPMAGLWLYFSCFEEAHKLADFCESAEGELWHGIIHRQEPDSGNAAYWFRKVGVHPTFQIMEREVVPITKKFREAEFRGYKWDPYAFISFCDRARLQPGSAQELAAMEIQRLEWQVLFDYSTKETD